MSALPVARLPGPGTALLAQTLAYAIVAVVMLLPNVRWPYHDAAIFSTIGEGIWRGDLPYRDLWDHKPPLVYLVGSFGWHALWASTIMALVGTGLVIRSMAGSFVALVAVCSAALYPAALGGGQTETLGMLPAAGGLLLATQGRWVAAGLATVAALMFSFQFAPLPIACLVLGGRWRYALAAASVVLVALLVTLAAGILPFAWDALFTYSSAYLRSSRSGDLHQAWHMGLVVIPLALALRVRPSQLDRAMLVWIAVGAVAIALQGRLLPHYATALVIPLAILARHAGRQRRLLVSVALLLAVVMSMVAWRSYPQRGPATEAIGQWVKAETGANARILVWGVDANIYLVADRAPAGRYPYLIPLVTPGYTTPETVSEWVQDLIREPPAVIVDSEAANPHWPDGEDFLRPPPPGAAGGRNLDIVEPFREFVRNNYEFVTEIDGRKIWRLRPVALAWNDGTVDAAQGYR